MRQRVAIATALINDPQVVIADEPTTALDVTTQASVLELLDRKVAERDCALLLITHDLGVVADRCDSTAVMYEGRIVEYGATATVLAQPRHPYTQALVECARALERHDSRRLPTLAPVEARSAGGCVYASRCPIRADDPRCLIEQPTLDGPNPLAAGQVNVACHHRGEEMR
jgi:oligopeptide/dipeptide ABC transporter ATP-binding protein